MKLEYVLAHLWLGALERLNKEEQKQGTRAWFVQEPQRMRKEYRTPTMDAAIRDYALALQRRGYAGAVEFCCKRIHTGNYAVKGYPVRKIT